MKYLNNNLSELFSDNFLVLFVNVALVYIEFMNKDYRKLFDLGTFHFYETLKLHN
jgi:hypothetical protein